MWCTYMRHQTAMFSEANLHQLYNHWKHCIEYVIKTPVKYFILFQYYDFMSIHIFVTTILNFRIITHQITTHRPHAALAIIACCYFYLGYQTAEVGICPNWQLAIFAHDSHFSWATEIEFISSSSWATQLSLTLFLLSRIILTFQLN